MTTTSTNATDTVFTPCRICLASCGLKVSVDRSANEIKRISPDKDNPYSWRDFCEKGRTANELVTHERRIKTPMRRVGDRFVEATYEEALADIGARLRAIMDEHGPDAVGTYSGNPTGFQMATIMLFGGLQDAIGTRNRYFVGSVDQNGLHLVAEKMFGSPMVNLVTDIDHAQCFLLIGTNPAVSAMNWTDSSPDGWRRILRARDAGADLIVVDPRRTETAAEATSHLAVRPGADWALLLGLLQVVFEAGLVSEEACRQASHVDELRELARSADLSDLANRCGIDAERIRDVARRFASAPSGFCVTRTGPAHTRRGTLAEWLGHALNLVCGRVDAQGGRRYERGVLDLPKLTASLLEASDHRSRVRGLPAIVGYHSLAELPGEITTPGPDQIRAMVMVAGNPVASGPDGRALDVALGQLDLLVAVDLVQRESHRHADWLIPGVHWLERDEVNVIVSSVQERPFVQAGRRAVAPPPGVRPEWEFFVDLALELRRPLFGRRGVNALIRTSRRVTRLTGRPGLAFNPRWMERAMVAIGRRVHWRTIMASPHGVEYAQPEYGTFAKAVTTADGRVDAAPPDLVAALQIELRTQPLVVSRFVLINRRQRGSMNSWLNDLPSLQDPQSCSLEVHPDDADRLGLVDGQEAFVSNDLGEIALPVKVSDAVAPGVVCAPHGWGTGVFDPVHGAEPLRLGVNRNLLTSNEDIDPLSQVAAFNETEVDVRPAPGVAR